MNHRDQPLSVWIKSDESVLVNVIRKSNMISFDNTKPIAGFSVRQAERRLQKMHGLVSKGLTQLGRWRSKTPENLRKFGILNNLIRIELPR